MAIKKTLRKNVYRYRCWIEFAIIQVVVVLVIGITISLSSYATESNTYTLIGKIEDVEYYFPSGSGTSLVYMQMDTEKYQVKRKLLARPIESTVKNICQEDKIILTVTQYQKRSPLRYGYRQEREIVDIRSDTEVYLDMEDYNKNVRAQRITMYIIVFFFWIIFSMFSVLMIVVDNKKTTRKRKKKTV